MNRTRGAFVMLAAWSLSAWAVPGDAGVRRGMSAREVRDRLGMPSGVSKQLLYRRHVEHWRYDAAKLLVEVDCVRGEEPVVAAVGPLLP